MNNSSSTVDSGVQDWTPSSWRNFLALQQPEWPDPDAHSQALKELSSFPPLVFAGESRDLTESLANVCNGKAFLLQAGDCAESFDTSADSIRDRLRVILQMAIVLTYFTGVPVIKVGRIAGQFAKPRSNNTETVDGVELPSFRGHIVNNIEFSADERVPDPQRLLTAYNRASSTLNLLRAFTKGGFADISHVHQWNREFVADSPSGQRYEALADEIERAVKFMEACGITSETLAELRQVDFFTSHEALLLDYEEALTREDSLTGDWYDCSAHMLWIGERTRQTDGAHVEFLRGVKNPIGCKVGPDATTEEVLEICESLNSERIPGRLTLIVRMGAKNITDKFPPILQAVKESGHPVVWVCDPMHANTFTAEGGRKTRHFEDVLSEVSGFFAVHRSEGTHPGGVHLELTGDNVTECLGGGAEVVDSDLEERYETMCDPRLNGSQSIDLAFRVAELLRNGQV